MKRILIIQENGHHERNRQFRECFCLQRAFEQFSVKADVWGKGHDNFSRPFAEVVRSYDAVVSLENYDSGWHPDLSKLSMPKVFWCIDAHMGVAPYLDFVKANRFDVVFNATRRFVDDFKPLAGDSLWLPNAYDSSLIDKLPNVAKTIPLGFCGNVVNRGEWIDYLQKRFGLHHHRMVIGPDMVRAVNSYQIHWNLNVSIDINYRNFETLGCGTFLLTNAVPDLEKLFVEDEHAVFYRNKSELDEKLHHYLGDEKARQRIAENGYTHVRRHHTYTHRARQILAKLGFPTQPAAVSPQKATDIHRTAHNRMKDKTFLFVSGATKSGTTLLANALGCSDRISILKSARGKVEEGQWHQNVYEWGSGNKDLTEAYHYTEDHPLVTDENRGRLFDSWSRMWDLSKPILAEKSPHNIIKSRFLQAMFPESRFIFLVRNGIVQATGEALQEKRDPITCCREWVAAYEMLMKDLSHLKRWLVVRYEDITNHIESTFNRIWDFLHVPRVDIRDEEFYVHHFKNGVARPDFNKIKDMNKPHILNFLRSFDAETQQAMMEACGPVMEKFGYCTDMESFYKYVETEDHSVLLSGGHPQMGDLASPEGTGKVVPSETESSTASAVSPSPERGADMEIEALKGVPIAIVTETLNYVSGGVRCIAEILNRLKKRGFDTSCYVTHPDLRCQWLDVEFPILPISEFHKFKGIAISPYSPTAEIVARSNAAGKFYWVHSYEPKFPEITGRSDQWRVMSEASYQFDGVHYFAVSTYVKMILELIYGRTVLSPLVPGGVDTRLFKPRKKENGPLKIMFLGREHGFRGADDIRQALEQVRKWGIDFEVHVMGQPVDLGAIPHIHRPPLPQAEFAELLAGMDLFIHASHFEGLPLPPLEAMASGCAVIATYIGASDYLLNGHNALVVPPKRPDKIAHAIRRLVEDEALRQKLQEGGLETVRQNYTWDHTADRLLEALAEGMKLSPVHRAPRIAIPPMDTKKEAEVAPRTEHAGGYLVSAIVSTYNSEKYIQGCLEDLEAQTIADRLEIIVVDSGSEQDEAAIIRAFQKKYDNIKYIRTRERETVYKSWNRAIKAASGKYVTNANTDDRHRRDAYEVMTRVLEAMPEVALVYADVVITETGNETFENHTPAGYYKWRNFDRQFLLEGKCFVGPQPMWRRSVHEEYGYFDDAYVTSGDFEFWLRISQTHSFLHLPVALGLYLKSPDSIEHRNRRFQQEENLRLLEIYRNAHKEGKVVRRPFRGEAAHRPPLKKAQKKAPAADNATLVKLKRQVDVYRHMESYDRAVNLLSRAIVKWPEEKSLHYRLCEHFMDAEQYDEALKVLESSPIPQTALKRVELTAAIFDAMGRNEDTRKVLDSADANELTSATLFNLKGVVAYKAGKTDEARTHFEKALNLDPQYGPAFTNMGLLMIASDNPVGGLKFLERGFKTAPTEAHVFNTYHEAVTEMGEFERAEPLFRKAAGKYPYHKQLNYLFIDLLIQQQKYEKAMAAIETAIAVFGVADGILTPALNIREKVGALEISDEAGEAPSVSLCMIVKNEEKTLARCLLSAARIADEIIVADTGSTDKTREVAAAFGAKVYEYQWNDDFSQARNFALDQAKGKWIFILDADETVSKQDHKRFRELIGTAGKPLCAYSFVTRNYVNDVGLEGWQANDGKYKEAAGAGWCPSTKVRLFPNNEGLRFENTLHEKVEPSLEREGIAVKSCDIPIHHYGKLIAGDSGQKKRDYYLQGRKKLAENETNLDALVENAIQAGEVGEFQTAADLWERVLARKPDYAKAHFNLGYVKIHLRDYQGAKAASERALSLDPTLKEAALNLSICELRGGEIGESVRLLEAFLAVNPEHPMAMGNLGVVYCISDQKEKGFALFERVQKMGFDCDEFIAHHVAELNAAGKPEMAASLENAAARHLSAGDSVQDDAPHA